MIFDRILRRDFLAGAVTTVAGWCGLRRKPPSGFKYLDKLIQVPKELPPAISIPFGVLPTDVYIRGPRYRVVFDRIYAPVFAKDIDHQLFTPRQYRLINTRQASRRCILEEPT